MKMILGINKKNFKIFLCIIILSLLTLITSCSKKEDNNSDYKFYFLSATNYDTLDYALLQKQKVAVKVIDSNLISTENRDKEIEEQMELRKKTGYTLMYINYKTDNKILIDTEYNTEIEIGKYYVFTYLNESVVQTDTFNDFNSLKNEVLSIKLKNPEDLIENDSESNNTEKTEETKDNNESNINKDVCETNGECE